MRACPFWIPRSRPRPRLRLTLFPGYASRRSFDPGEPEVHRFSFRRATLGPYMFSSMCIFAISASLWEESSALVPPPLSLTEASGASRSQRERRRDGARAIPPAGFQSRFCASVIGECISPPFLFPCLGREMRPLPLRKGQRCRVRARSALGWPLTSPQPSLSRTWPVLQTRTVARAPVSAGSSYL